MRKEIHPDYKIVTVECSCGNKFESKTTASKGLSSMHVTICSKCHPYYTGKQRTGVEAGRVEKFKQKYGLK